MFAYCGNNPITRLDPNGQFWADIGKFIVTVAESILQTVSGMSAAYAGCGGLAVVDGPLPIGDTFALVGAIAITAGAVASGIYQATQSLSISIPKAGEKEKDTTPPPSNPTIIFRYHSSKTKNLAPRPGIDFDGLSFSTKPPKPGVSAVVTSIEHVNATGILMAIPTGGSHVTIVPKYGTVGEWMEQGQSSIWSQILSSVVIEWGG